MNISARKLKSVKGVMKGSFTLETYPDSAEKVNLALEVEL